MNIPIVKNVRQAGSWERALNHAAIGAPLGAAGLGIAGLIGSDPEDDAEERRRKLYKNLAFGAALGGIGGAGLSVLKPVGRDIEKQLSSSYTPTQQAVGWLKQLTGSGYLGPIPPTLAPAVAYVSAAKAHNFADKSTIADVKKALTDLPGSHIDPATGKPFTTLKELYDHVVKGANPGVDIIKNKLTSSGARSPIMSMDMKRTIGNLLAGIKPGASDDVYMTLLRSLGFDGQQARNIKAHIRTANGSRLGAGPYRNAAAVGLSGLALSALSKYYYNGSNYDGTGNRASFGPPPVDLSNQSAVVK